MRLGGLAAGLLLTASFLVVMPSASATCLQETCVLEDNGCLVTSSGRSANDVAIACSGSDFCAAETWNPETGQSVFRACGNFENQVCYDVKAGNVVQEDCLAYQPLVDEANDAANLAIGLVLAGAGIVMGAAEGAVEELTGCEIDAWECLLEPVSGCRPVGNAGSYLCTGANGNCFAQEDDEGQTRTTIGPCNGEALPLACITVRNEYTCIP